MLLLGIRAAAAVRQNERTLGGMINGLCRDTKDDVMHFVVNTV